MLPPGLGGRGAGLGSGVHKIQGDLGTLQAGLLLGVHHGIEQESCMLLRVCVGRGVLCKAGREACGMGQLLSR